MVDEPKQPVWHISSRTRNNARRLRREMTDAERVMWKALRAHRLNGAGFKRQKPIGAYIVDFVCDAAQLVIEIDGGQHYEKTGIANDRHRDDYLKTAGFEVLRFSNADVLANLPGTLETIATMLNSKSPLPPSPASGGGEESESAS